MEVVASESHVGGDEKSPIPKFPVNFRYSVLFGFHFESDESRMYIAELKALDAPSDAPPSKKYFWVLGSTNNNDKSPSIIAVEYLGFKEMSGQQRWFLDDSFLDMEALIYIDKNQTQHSLSQDIPEKKAA
eukprot:TRINITY_DN20557_c0_g2_i1.p1 TRINITY_DN20557_c0_g2~~TRINITY_DN20557_c0_g2_i1.p1  ORF type:complete len:130 (+),score=29.60 TRINITY_DN20557_c0_g2_i1:532-921(+)